MLAHGLANIPGAAHASGKGDQIALGWGAGAELRQPMAVAIIGGLVTSTLLSLVVVPVLYTLLEDGWQALGKRFAAK
jgi:hypothetical protein